MSSVVDKAKLKALRQFFRRFNPDAVYGFEVEMPIWNRNSDTPGNLGGTVFDSMRCVVGRDGAPRLVEIRFPPRSALWWLSDEPLRMLRRKIEMVAKFFAPRNWSIVGDYNAEYFQERTDPQYPIASGIHFHIPVAVMRRIDLWDTRDAEEYCDSYAAENCVDEDGEIDYDCCSPAEVLDEHNADVIFEVFGGAVRKSKEILGDRRSYSQYGGVSDFRLKPHGIEVRGFESTYHYPEWFAVTIFNAFESLRAAVENEKPRLVEYPKRRLRLFLDEMVRIPVRWRTRENIPAMEIIDGFSLTADDIRDFRRRTRMPSDVAWVYKRDCFAVRSEGRVVMMYTNVAPKYFRVLWAEKNSRIVEAAAVAIMRFNGIGHAGFVVPRQLWKYFREAGFVDDGEGVFVGWRRTWVS